MVQQHKMTYKELFRNSILNLSSIADQNESEALLRIAFCHLLQCNPAKLLSIMNDECDKDFITDIEKIILRLQQHEPIQYILGETIFCDCKILVNKNVLIPRPETEELVEWICSLFERKSEFKITDLCTGSGCIAIALKKYFAQSSVYGFDISEQAIEVAKQNAKINNVSIGFCMDDILETNTKNYLDQNDIIVSNPPYVSQHDKAKMSANVLNYEPHIALFPEHDDVLIFYKTISNLAMQHLKMGGSLFFEINESHALEVENILRENKFSSIEIKKDMFGKNRFARAIKN